MIQADCRDSDTTCTCARTHTITGKATINDGNNVNTEPMLVRENESKTTQDGEREEERKRKFNDLIKSLLQPFFLLLEGRNTAKRKREEMNTVNQPVVI